MSVDTNWFKKRIEEAGKTQRAAAADLGVDPSSFSLMLRGRRAMKMQEAVRLSRFLSVPIDQVMAHAGIAEAAQVPVRNRDEVPLVGYIEGDAGELIVDQEPEDPSTPTVPGPGQELTGEIVAVIVRAAQSKREIMDGWTFFFRPSKTVDPEVIGRMSIVRLLNGPTLVRQVRRGYRPGTYNLIDALDASIENATLVWATPVLWIRT